jgi:cysteinyl-tRNA synthetase
MDRVLGLDLVVEAAAALDAPAAEDPVFAAEVEALIAKRTEAKKARDFAAADAVRAALKDRGVILEDGPSGTLWRRA